MKKVKKKKVVKKSEKATIDLDETTFTAISTEEMIEIINKEFEEVYTPYPPKSDGIKFIDSNIHSEYPEIYESFDNGHVVSVSNGYVKGPYMSMTDSGSGMCFKHNSTEIHLSYCDIDFIIRSALIMDGIQGGIFGTSWWVGHKNDVGDFYDLVKKLKDK